MSNRILKILGTIITHSADILIQLLSISSLFLLLLDNLINHVLGGMVIQSIVNG